MTCDVQTDTFIKFICMYTRIYVRKGLSVFFRVSGVGLLLSPRQLETFCSDLIPVQ